MQLFMGVCTDYNIAGVGHILSKLYAVSQVEAELCTIFHHSTDGSKEYVTVHANKPCIYEEKGLAIRTNGLFRVESWYVYYLLIIMHSLVLALSRVM